MYGMRINERDEKNYSNYNFILRENHWKPFLSSFSRHSLDTNWIILILLLLHSLSCSVPQQYLIIVITPLSIHKDYYFHFHFSFFCKAKCLLCIWQWMMLTCFFFGWLKGKNERKKKFSVLLKKYIFNMIM